MSTNGTVPTLEQRLVAIEAEIEPIKPTGHNEYSKPALSISDVEEALRPLLAKHRVLTRWRRKTLERIENRLWRAELIVRVVNADDGEDAFEEEWEDVGSNPSAAYSFTRKGYYKALFHLADDDEDATRREDPPPSDRRAASKPREQKPPKEKAAAAAVPADQIPNAKQLEELYGLAESLPTTPKDHAWVDDQLTQHGRLKVLVALLKQHRTQCGSESCAHVPNPVTGEEALAAEPDPDEAVCPHCGHDGTLGQKPEGGFRCKVSSGGCGKSFEAPIRRSEFVKQESLA